MKKIFSALMAATLSLLLCIGLVACGDTGNSSGNGSGSGVTDNTDDNDNNNGNNDDTDNTDDNDDDNTDDNTDDTDDNNDDDGDHLDDGRAIYTITFDSQGGSAIPSQTAVEGTSARDPDSPTRDGYNFLGWYTEAEGGVEWKWNDLVNGNITVYAHWEANTVSDATASLEYTYDTALGGYVVTGVGQESALRIPAEYNGTRGTHPVVGIDERAFAYSNHPSPFPTA